MTQIPMTSKWRIVLHPKFKNGIFWHDEQAAFQQELLPIRSFFTPHFPLLFLTPIRGSIYLSFSPLKHELRPSPDLYKCFNHAPLCSIVPCARGNNDVSHMWFLPSTSRISHILLLSRLSHRVSIFSNHSSFNNSLSHSSRRW